MLSDNGLGMVCAESESRQLQTDQAGTLAGLRPEADERVLRLGWR